MSGGNTHAKQILINETLANVKKLENGSAGDLHIIGDTLSKVARITCAIFENDFVTEESCKKKHSSVKRQKSSMRIKIGPVEVEGPMTAAVIIHSIPVVCCVMLLVVVGKLQNWW